MHLSLYSAGLALGDPGPIGLGGGLYDDANRELAILCESPGEGSPIEAEYLALIRLLEMAVPFRATRIACHISSAAAAQQIEGHTFLPDERLLDPFLRIHDLLGELPDGYTFVALPPRQNQWANKLALLALDARYIRRGRPSVLDWANLSRGPVLI